MGVVRGDVRRLGQNGGVRPGDAGNTDNSFIGYQQCVRAKFPEAGHRSRLDRTCTIVQVSVIESVLKPRMKRSYIAGYDWLRSVIFWNGS